ncbi:hypothetical protein LOC68_22030 [Blastopirellula sp. JC732]|uniref:Carboxypeptidase regulatory-like domain-containing protein n=1 Tax=Blastopirellula sediminis TaxID=2894196 RepID=A0A9X1MRI6_9BACT|nr:hypothetical protein [Blastopirellula sediminis]MCC9605620.1 hypothetical protein [Blastopirellula sediminis]MCC9631080.1 hypothetical protein [Blastopirellula sediminis]
MKRFTLQLLPAFALLACSALIGCSAADGVQKVDVQGAVRMDGEPLSNIIVRFYSPTGGGGGFTTTADGQFKSPAPIKVGAYNVAFVAPAAAPGMGTPTTGILAKVPPHYWSVQDSGLEVTVTSSGPNEFALDISASDKPPAGFRAPRPSAKGPTALAPVSSDT